jgi:hypothetical protein
MSKEFKYTRTTVTKLSAVGLIDTDNGTIEVEGETKNLLELLKDFNGANISLAVQVREEIEI